jgi:hypothetical protein
VMSSVARLLKQRRAMTLSELSSATGSQPAQVQACLRRLAFSGQVIHDLPNGVYRFRQVMPMPLGEEQLGPENPELAGARQLSLTSRVKLESTQKLDRGFVLVGKAESNEVEVMIDLDGRIRRGKCGCSHFRKFGIRNGPCRHMIALRYAATSAIAPAQVGALKTNGYAARN